MNRRSYKGDQHPNWNGGKTNIRGYIGIFSPNHPRAIKERYVYEQILVAEKALNKPLPRGALVHHFNENPQDNRNENLIICQGTSYHQILHRRMKAFKKSGHPNWRQCIYCKQWDDPENLYIWPDDHKVCHKSCSAKEARERYIPGVKAVSTSSMAATGKNRS